MKKISINMRKCMCVFLLCSPLIALCQTSFNMTFKEGRYFINSTINNTNAEIVVGSGRAGILINENDYGRLFVDSLYQTVDSGYSEIKYVKGSKVGSYPVSKIKYGKVYIGDLSYQGNIYVLDKYDRISVPIHLLRNEKDTTANIMRFNFRKRTLDFVRQDAIDRTKMHEYKMVEISPMPVVETTLFLRDTYDHSGSIKGKFIFEFGNANPLYLSNRNPSVLSFIKEKGFRVLPATDKSGKNAGYGIYAGYCEVGERKITHASIGFTDCTSDYIGCIGPSFFAKGYVLIDRKNNIIYYQ